MRGYLDDETLGEGTDPRLLPVDLGICSPSSLTDADSPLPEHIIRVVILKGATTVCQPLGWLRVYATGNQNQTQPLPSQT